MVANVKMLGDLAVLGCDAVLFDLDGTLVKTRPQYWHTTLRKTLRQFGMVGLDPAHFDAFWYEYAKDDVIRACFGVEPEVFWPVYRETGDFELRKQHASLYPDVSVVSDLKQRYKIGIVTGAPEDVADYEIGLLEQQLGKVFDEIVIARPTQGIRPKPDPHGLEECMERLDTTPEACVYIGNARDDVHAAEAAGMMCILVDRKEYVFKGLDHQFVVDDLHALLSVYCL